VSKHPLLNSNEAISQDFFAFYESAKCIQKWCLPTRQDGIASGPFPLSVYDYLQSLFNATL